MLIRVLTGSWFSPCIFEYGGAVTVGSAESLQQHAGICAFAIILLILVGLKSDEYLYDTCFED